MLYDTTPELEQKTQDVEKNMKKSRRTMKLSPGGYVWQLVAFLIACGIGFKLVSVLWRQDSIEHKHILLIFVGYLILAYALIYVYMPKKISTLRVASLDHTSKKD